MIAADTFIGPISAALSLAVVVIIIATVLGGDLVAIRRQTMSTSKIGDEDRCASDRCAACGKSGGGLKKCGACLEVKYCSRECQSNDRPTHRRACQKRAKELLDEDLFKTPPSPRDDCPICFLPLPMSMEEATFQHCCGQRICNGCGFACAGEKMFVVRAGAAAGDIPPCAFCRSPAVDSEEEIVGKLKTRAAADDVGALFQLGDAYLRGSLGVRRDINKAIDLLSQAAELGSIVANTNLGVYHYTGKHVVRDVKKAEKHMQFGALKGDELARCCLGKLEYEVRGDSKRALRHWVIAARSGCNESLRLVRQGFMNGTCSKAVFEQVLRAHKDSCDERRSPSRDKALAALAGMMRRAPPSVAPYKRG